MSSEFLNLHAKIGILLFVIISVCPNFLQLSIISSKKLEQTKIIEKSNLLTLSYFECNFEILGDLETSFLCEKLTFASKKRSEKGQFLS